MGIVLCGAKISDRKHLPNVRITLEVDLMFNAVRYCYTVYHHHFRPFLSCFGGVTTINSQWILLVDLWFCGILSFSIVLSFRIHFDWLLRYLVCVLRVWIFIINWYVRFKNSFFPYSFDFKQRNWTGSFFAIIIFLVIFVCFFFSFYFFLILFDVRA